jgi:hypothetical protein
MMTSRMLIKRHQRLDGRVVRSVSQSPLELVIEGESGTPDVQH